MTRKTLSEAAAEVLKASISGASKEPMHKLDNTGSGLDSVHDIGGSTFNNPQGGDVGSKSAAGAPSAIPPGTQPDAGSKEGMHHLAKTGANTASSGTNHVDLDDALSTTGDKVKTHANEEADLEAARLDRMEEIKAALKAVGGMKEDMEALFSGTTLSEEFKTKATTIFEAAVQARALAVVEQVEKQVLEAAEEAVQETHAELAEQIENYLNLMVPEWVKNNEVAIESGLRAEVVESFISGMKTLFAEHYIDVPADQVDVVAAQADEIEELTAKVNEAINTNAELQKRINESQKKEILNKVCEGLTATQIEKVKTLAEGVEFVTADDYTKKVAVLKEGYASTPKVKDSKTTNVVALTESADGAVSQKPTDIDPSVAAHLRALR
jgi:hypothetical protein